MKPDQLEEYIKKNREAFELFEPSPKVWEKISKATREKRKTAVYPFFLRAAAILIIAVAIPALIIMIARISPSKQSVSTNDPELKELIEAEAYYANQVDDRLRQIRKCYSTFPEIREDVETDLTELEYMYFELKKDLQENMSKKMVIEAMIDNNRTRLKIVDQILEQINC